MIRHCDGTDPNLTRDIGNPPREVGTYTISPWNDSARPGQLIINCQCGRSFDDVDRSVIYPHDSLGGGRAEVFMAPGPDGPWEHIGHADGLRVEGHRLVQEES